MKVMVTGATGFIGSHTVAALVGGGHQVRALVRTPDKARSVLAELGVDGVELVAGDATDPAAVAAALQGCDAALHAAAVVALGRAEGRAARAANVTAAELVLSAAVGHGCDPVVHVSSASVFALGGPPVRADSPLRDPVGDYARSKLDVERFARGMQAGGAPVVITYPVGVAGPVSPTLTAVHKAAQTWLKYMPVMPSGINLVDVRDVAAAHLAIVDGAGRTPPARHVLGGHFISWSDLADLTDELRRSSIPRYRTPGSVIRGVGRFMDLTRLSLPVDFDLTHEAMTDATRAVPVDRADAESALGMTFRPLRPTLADTYEWLIATGAA